LASPKLFAYSLFATPKFAGNRGGEKLSFVFPRLLWLGGVLKPTWKAKKQLYGSGEGSMSEAASSTHAFIEKSRSGSGS
jgi:hypothetical protein